MNDETLKTLEIKICNKLNSPHIVNIRETNGNIIIDIKRDYYTFRIALPYCEYMCIIEEYSIDTVVENILDQYKTNILHMYFKF